MLHWSSWWSHSTRDSEASSAPTPGDPEPWDHENAVRLQTRFWEQWLDAQRSWWTMYAGVLPTMTRPTAAPPVKPGESGEPGTGAEPVHRHHHHPPGVERKWPVASGPAAAKLKQQRRRAGLKPNEGSR